MDDENVALGIAAQTYFEHLIKEEDPTSSESQRKCNEKLQTIFLNATDVKTDLLVGFMVFTSVSVPSCFDYTSVLTFEQVVSGIKVLQEAGIKTEEAKVFIEADAWLRARR